MKASDWWISEDLGPDSPILFESFWETKTAVELFSWPEKFGFMVAVQLLKTSDEYGPLSQEASEKPDAYLHFSAK